MKVQKVMRAEGEFAKPGEDFRDQDVVVLKDAGTVITGEWGDRNVFKIETSKGERNFTINQTSMNNLIEAFGDETEAWVGKNIKIFIVKQMVGNELKNVCYAVAENWTMDSKGKFMPEEPSVA